MSQLHMHTHFLPLPFPLSSFYFLFYFFFLFNPLRGVIFSLPGRRIFLLAGYSADRFSDFHSLLEGGGERRRGGSCTWISRGGSCVRYFLPLPHSPTLIIYFPSLFKSVMSSRCRHPAADRVPISNYPDAAAVRPSEVYYIYICIWRRIGFTRSCNNL